MRKLRPLLLVFASALACALAVACSVDFHVGARPTGPGPDASAADDGGVSDADASEAGVVHWCNEVVGADFCADFETGDVESGWDHQITVGGKVELDRNRGFDSAQSALFRVPSGAESATLVKKFLGPWRPTTVELDTFVALPNGPDDMIALMAVALGSDAADQSASAASFVVIVSPTAVTLRVLSPDEHQKSSTKPLPYDRWVHVVFTLDWEKKSAAVTVDGDPVVSYDDFPSNIQVGTNFETQLRVGAAVIPPIPVPAVNHDNVVVRRR